MVQIKRTGYQNFLDDSANIKQLIVGGPGVGKTRYSSFWPKPFFLFCEPGHGAIADRQSAYADITGSSDMIDALAYLKQQQIVPKHSREYQTVVWDTADGFLRKVKDEWLQKSKAASFTGYEAWGYLETKMQIVMTRLLNLDYHVIVLAHWKTKANKVKGEEETTETVLQLQGDVTNYIFNDFDLVGWMDTYWEGGEEGREQKRGITFETTPQRPFLKDRFGIMPRWVPITFTPNDYEQQREAFLARVAEEKMTDVEVLGEIPRHKEQQVVGAAAIEGGPVPEQEARELPLSQLTKKQLEDKAKGLGLTFKGNVLKAEMIVAIEAKLAEKPPEPETPAEGTPEGTSEGAETAPDSASPQVSEPVAEDIPTDGQPTPEVPGVRDAPSDAPQTDVEPGTPTHDQAIQVVEQVAGGQVVEDTNEPGGVPPAPVEPEPVKPVEPPAEPPTLESQQKKAATQAAAGVCEDDDCGKPLANEPNQGAVQLSYVKFRKRLCNDHYATALQAKKGK